MNGTSLCKVSAPGKTILHGEHAVVYGKAAVAASIDLRTYVTASPEESCVVLELLDLKYVESWSTEQFTQLSVSEEDCRDNVVRSEALVPKLADLFKLKTGSKVPTDQAKLAFLFLYVGTSLAHGRGRFLPIRLSVTSELPVGAGLGSSASYATAVAAALLAQRGAVHRPLSNSDRDRVCSWAFQAECILHGRPSGIDNAVCTYGGCTPSRLRLTNCFSIPSYKVVLINTEVARNTKTLVASVRTRHDQYPDVVKPVLESIEAISETCWKLLKHPESSTEVLFRQATELVRMNQCLLNCLGVGHTSLDQVAALAASQGFSAKLTGAGGGGCALLVYHVGSGDTGAPAVQDLLAAEGFQCWRVELGCPGVTLH
ncbi:mevalonate kinase, putative [Ixodes scapularis]|uniref:Mevalonate kinase n=1 Tax=Ixodes scapularis TaxID=6945 RepID=B7PKR3_IXOSC|nr:mevalonate kinase, putative [Ixodes scapularis]|eukprot:XP_002434361.1 mevalonate kinase, putative [Ixodes scapularis]